LCVYSNGRLTLSPQRFQPFFLNIYQFAQQRLSCSKYVLVVQVFLVFQQVFICGELDIYHEKDTKVFKISVTLTLRTYALYGCSRRLLKWMAIIGLALVAGASVRVCDKLWTLESPELLGGIFWT
jgi:hypothetical protein